MSKALLQADLENSYKTIKNDIETLSSNISAGMAKIITSNIDYSNRCKEEVEDTLSHISSEEEKLVAIIKDCESITENIHKMEMFAEKLFCFL